MIDWIVLVAVVFALAFSVAWLVRPGLRVWIEKPKYRFQANVRAHDEARRR